MIRTRFNVRFFIFLISSLEPQVENCAEHSIPPTTLNMDRNQTKNSSFSKKGSKINKNEKDLQELDLKNQLLQLVLLTPNPLVIKIYSKVKKELPELQKQ